MIDHRMMAASAPSVTISCTQITIVITILHSDVSCSRLAQVRAGSVMSQVAICVTVCTGCSCAQELSDLPTLGFISFLLITFPCLKPKPQHGRQHGELPQVHQVDHTPYTRPHLDPGHSGAAEESTGRTAAKHFVPGSRPWV